MLTFCVLSCFWTSAQTAPTTQKRPHRSRETAFTTLQEKGWVNLFDSKTLTGWKETPFPGQGTVQITDGTVELCVGSDMTGITWTNPVLRTNYEVTLEAMRVNGSDFFCGLTFPVENEYCSLIVGGWGGSVVGLSSIDGADAANNETATARNFESKRWYRIRVRVTPGQIEAWIDQEKMVDFKTSGRRLSTRREVDLSKPFGVATWQTTGALRDFRWRRLEH